MKIKITAPFRIHLNTRNEARLGNTSKYRRSWNELSDRVKSSESVKQNLVREPTFPHREYRKQTELQYKRVDTSSDLNTPELVRFKPGRKILSSVPDKSIETGQAILNLSWSQSKFLSDTRFRFFDHTIGICESIIRFQPDRQQILDLDEEYFANIQDWLTSFHGQVISSYYDSCLLPFLQDIHATDESEKVLQDLGSYLTFPDLKPPPVQNEEVDHGGEVLWVNRSIVVDDPDEELETALKKTWMDGSRIEEFGDVNLGWGHNLMLTENEETLKPAWEALVLAQYYYSTMNTIDLNLTTITGNSLSHLKFKETEQQLNQLDQIITSHQLLLMNYEDKIRYLVGQKFEHLKHLRSIWDFDDLIHNMKSKIKTCQERLDKQHQETVETSQSIMEILLYVLGGIGLIDVLLGISDYGLDLYKHQYYADLGLWDMPGLIDLSLRFPPDAFLWFGVGLLFVSSAFFAWFQMRY